MDVIDNRPRPRSKKEQLAGKRTKLAKSPITKISLQHMGEEEPGNQTPEDIQPLSPRFPPGKTGKYLLVSVLALAILAVVFLAVRQLLPGRAEKAAGGSTQALSQETDSPGLVIRSRDGGRVWVGERQGILSIEVLDKEGRPRVLLTLPPGKEPEFTLLDQSRQPRLALTLEPEKKPSAKPKEKSESAGPPAQETAKPETALPQKPVAYVGAVTSNKYHYPNCKWVRLIGPQGRITFQSVKEAKEKGYIPCPTCKPPLNEPSQ